MTPQEIVDKIDSPEIPYEVYFTINEFLDNNEENGALVYLQNYFNCIEDVAMETLALYKKTLYMGHVEVREKISPQQIAYNNAVAKELLNKPKCPTCSSTNVQKISSLSKAGSVAVFGIFSQKVKHQFKCNNCGYEW